MDIAQPQHLLDKSRNNDYHPLPRWRYGHDGSGCSTGRRSREEATCTSKQGRHHRRDVSSPLRGGYFGNGHLSIVMDINWIGASGSSQVITNFQYFLERNCNNPPIAICDDVEVQCSCVSPGNCLADASINNGSYDPDGDSIVLTQVPPGPYPTDETTLVTLTVTDPGGDFTSCEASVTVVDVDSDDDGVNDCDDLCLDTIIPEETVPSKRLGTNRWALFDDDLDFDTAPPNGKGPQRAFTMADTHGCSCEQIIEYCGYGRSRAASRPRDRSGWSPRWRRRRGCPCRRPAAARPLGIEQLAEQTPHVVRAGGVLVARVQVSLIRLSQVESELAPRIHSLTSRERTASLHS